MNCEEAMKALRSKQKVRDVSWDEGLYVYLNSEGDIVDNDPVPNSNASITFSTGSTFELVMTRVSALCMFCRDEVEEWRTLLNGDVCFPCAEKATTELLGD